MKNRKVRRDDLKTDPNNKNKTIPPSWGVWETPGQYHEGNYPVRERELVRDYGSATLIELHLDKASAQEQKKLLNG